MRKRSKLKKKNEWAIRRKHLNKETPTAAGVLNGLEKWRQHSTRNPGLTQNQLPFLKKKKKKGMEGSFRVEFIYGSFPFHFFFLLGGGNNLKEQSLLTFSIVARNYKNTNLNVVSMWNKFTFPSRLSRALIALKLLHFVG